MNPDPSITLDHTEFVIEGLEYSVIYDYFETLNTGDYAATAALFAPDGVMYPPFESAIAGSEAIARYLETEAIGMTLEPRQSMTEVTENGENQIKVIGKVQTPLFGVNVAWLFTLNDESEILSVRVKLLASLEELLSVKENR